MPPDMATVAHSRNDGNPQVALEGLVMISIFILLMTPLPALAGKAFYVIIFVDQEITQAVPH